MTRREIEKQIKEVTKQLKERYRPEKIILYGSCARGGYKRGSDIDILIVKRTKKKFIDRIGVVLKLVDYRIPIEPLVYTPSELNQRIKLGDFFISDVLREGKVLYEK